MQRIFGKRPSARCVVAAGLAWALLLCADAAIAQPQVVVSVVPANVAVDVGDLVEVEIRLDTGANTVGGGGVFLRFDAGLLEFVGGSVDVAVWNTGFVTTQPRVAQGAVVSFAVGRNGGVTAGDALVARLTFRASDAGQAELTFLFNADAEGTVFTQVDLVTEFRTEGTGARVAIVGPTATPTLPATPTPPATLTPAATATAAIPECVGDCGGDVAVTVDEILAMVGIALGSIPVDVCPRGDGNGDGEITVDEILTAVQHALVGCPAG